MKIHLKQFFLTVIILGSSQSNFAQISFGVKGHISMIGAPLVEKQDLFSKKLRSPLNPGFSIFAEYRFNDKLALQPELAYRENRSYYKLRSNVPTIHTSIINYVRLPIMFKISQQKKWITISFLIGPNFAYAFDMKAGETFTQFYFHEQAFKTLKFKDYNIRHFDLALTLGISVEKSIAQKFRTSLDLRYDFGLNDIMNELSSTFYNRGFALEMGILIPAFTRE